jgi:hypothetical protein
MRCFGFLLEEALGSGGEAPERLPREAILADGELERNKSRSE